MEKTRKMYVTAEEAAEILGVSTGYAYKLIRGIKRRIKRKKVTGRSAAKFQQSILKKSFTA